MATAQILFSKWIDQMTATAFIAQLRDVAWNAANGATYTDATIRISSGGGDIGMALAMHNEMLGTDMVFNTHNSGQVDSAAIMPFMAGKQRSAAEHSAFMFHQPAWTFTAAGGNPLTVVGDAKRWLDTYQQFMAEIISGGSNLSVADVIQLMHDGTTFDPKEALKAGLIHSIGQPIFQKGDKYFHS